MDEHRAKYSGKPVKTGRRLAVDIDSPRDRTVCFMVSDEERDQIDEIAVGIGKTRSALLTRIVTDFVSAVNDLDGESDLLASYLDECRSAMHRQ